VEYKRGRLNSNVDALSRYPGNPGVTSHRELGDNIISNLPATAPCGEEEGHYNPPATASFNEVGGYDEDQPNMLTNGSVMAATLPLILTIRKSVSGPFGAPLEETTPSPTTAMETSTPTRPTKDPDSKVRSQATTSLLKPSLAGELELAGLPIPTYMTAGVETDEEDNASPVPAGGVCDVCGTDDKPGELLVCEGCHRMTHGYCNDDSLPDGLLPAGDYFCNICKPCEPKEEAGDGSNSRGATKSYLDIWEDQETMAALQGIAVATTPRAKERMKHYEWDGESGMLLTTEGRRIVPRKEQRADIVQAAHESLGHRGYRSVADALRLSYTWKNMREDVKAGVKSCKACTINPRDLQPLINTSLQSIPPSNIFSRWTIDLVGPMPAAKDTGNRYIAVGVDSYSKMVVTGALPNKTADSVVRWFERSIMYTYGAPLQVMCDRGGEFMGAFQQLCDNHYIKISRGSAYHPQTQGLVERANQSLEKALAAYAGDQEEMWESYLHKATFSLNACKQGSTGFSPFYLATCIHPRIPLALKPATPHTEITVADAQAVRVAERVQTLDQDHSKAMDNVVKAQARQAEAYKRRKTTGGDKSKEASIEELKLQPGQLVWQKFKSKDGSWNWEGPYKVKEVLSKNLVTIMDQEEKSWSANRERLAVKKPR
jgi:transposase InsO family protein